MGCSMIDYVTSKGTPEPADSAAADWKLTRDGTAVFR